MGSVLRGSRGDPVRSVSCHRISQVPFRRPLSETEDRGICGSIPPLGTGRRRNE